MAFELSKVDLNQAHRAALLSRQIDGRMAAEQLGITRILRTLIPDEGVDEARKRWADDVDEEGNPTNPDWETIAYNSAVAAVEGVMTALYTLDRDNQGTVET
jgi:hypothetical protein